MLRMARAALVCVGVVFLLSGQEAVEQIRGFKIKPEDDAIVSSTGGVEVTPPIPIGCPPAISFSYYIGGYNPDADQETLMNFINQERAGAGAPALTWSSGLSKCAIDHLKTDPIDKLNSPFCYAGFSNIYQDLTLGISTSLNQEFVTFGPFFESWDPPGRLSSAFPPVPYTDLGIILARQTLPGGLQGNAATIYFGAIAGNRFTRNIIRDPRFTTMGSSFDPRLGTWVIILGEGVTL